MNAAERAVMETLLMVKWLIRLFALFAKAMFMIGATRRQGAMV